MYRKNKHRSSKKIFLCLLCIFVAKETEMNNLALVRYKLVRMIMTHDAFRRSSPCLDLAQSLPPTRWRGFGGGGADSFVA